MSYWGFREYVPVAQRRANALKEVEKLRKKGRVISPVVIEGRKIATSFWGKAWCDNLERYSDYENRLPRGRTYVNNGSVVDLQISRGQVEALVSGSEIYKIKIDIAVAAPARWKAICSDCAGSVGSIVELLQGKLSKHVMERVCRDADGLFPTPKEIKLSCSCPDWATMCKHVAATLYGVGARLDRDPDLLFKLRGVERSELVSTGADLAITEAAAGSKRVLAGDDVAALFGLEFETPPKPAAATPEKQAPVRKDVPAKAGQRKSSTLARATPEVRVPKPAVGSKLKPSRAAATEPEKPVSEVAAPKAAKVRTPASARRHEEASTAANLGGKAKPDRLAAAKPASAPCAKAKSSHKAKESEEPSQGRTRAAKWIGAKARRAARK